MRIGWETVGKILARVVAEKLPAGRLDGLALLGVDEVSYGADRGPAPVKPTTNRPRPPIHPQVTRSPVDGRERM
jgi:hypothetical protein